MKTNLRKRQSDIQLDGNLQQHQKKKISKRIRELSQRDSNSLSTEEQNILSENDKLVSKILKDRKTQELKKIRVLEFEDDISIVTQQCKELAKILTTSKHVVVYTGAGVSTSADIPDFRGTDGVWTRLNSGKDVILKQSLTSAEPTSAHMCLKALYDQGIIKHIVSQNCDGLHLRSGMPQNAISEIHGNMYMEICTDCKQQFYRIFDVTEKTSLRRHKTERSCEHCGNQLRDTIVHFGERSNLRWPHNWESAVENAENADVILCLGTSLKVLRSYKQLWMTSRPKHKRPALYIVNLQWTPKDSQVCSLPNKNAHSVKKKQHSYLVMAYIFQAVMKIHSHVDFVMETVTKQLGIAIPIYTKEKDPLYSLATPCDFNGPMLQITRAFETKFKSGGICNDVSCSATHKCTFTPQKKIRNQLNALPQNTEACNPEYAKDEFKLQHNTSICGESCFSHDDRSSKFYNTCTLSTELHCAIQCSRSNSRELARTSLPFIEDSTSDWQISSTAQCVREPAETEGSSLHSCVANQESYSLISKSSDINENEISPEGASECQTNDIKVGGNGYLQQSVESSTLKLEVDVKSDYKWEPMVPAWFGKGVKTKISACNRKMRRKKAR